MDAAQRDRATLLRARIAAGEVDPAAFRAALTAVAPGERDAWVDVVLDLEGIPADGPELPRGCVPYLPAPVDALLAIAEHVAADDVFVDVGSGAGRALALVHLLTGAAAIGLEVQPALVQASRALADRLGAARVSVIEGDVALTAGRAAAGTVFFLYCPFSGARLDRFLDELEVIARRRPLLVGALDLPLPPRAWLALASRAGGLELHRSS